MSALPEFDLVDRGVHTLRAKTSRGFFVIFAVTSDHRVVGRRILAPGVDPLEAERELEQLLDERDPVWRPRLVKSDPTPAPSVFASDDPAAVRALVRAHQHRYSGATIS